MQESLSPKSDIHDNHSIIIELAQKIDTLISKMEQNSESDSTFYSTSTKPNTFTYLIGIQAWEKIAKIMSIQREKKPPLNENSPDDRLNCDSINFSPEERADYYLEKMLNGDMIVKQMLSPAFVHSILAWSYSSLPNAPARGQQLLDLAVSEVTDPRRNFFTFLYSRVILSWIKKGDVEKAKNLLTQFENGYKDGSHGNCRPDFYSYDHILLGYSANGQEEELISFIKHMESEQKLLRVKDQSTTKNKKDKILTIVSYNAVLKFYTSNNKVSEAESFFKRLEDEISPEFSIYPNAETYNLLLLAYATSVPSMSLVEAQNTIRKSSQILEKMTSFNSSQPDFNTLTSCLKILNNSPAEVDHNYVLNLIEQIEEISQTMMKQSGQLKKDRKKSQQKFCHNMLQTLIKYKHIQKAKHFLNNVQELRILSSEQLNNLYSYANFDENSDENDSVTISETPQELLSNFLRDFKSGKSTFFPLKKHFHNAIVSSLISEHNCHSMKKYLDEMKEAHENGIPDIEPHTNFLNSILSDLRGRREGELAYEILNDIMESSTSSNMRPNSPSYRHTFYGLIRTTNHGESNRIPDPFTTTEKAESLFFRMMEEDISYKPTLQDLHLILRKYSSSDHPGLIKKMGTILFDIENVPIAPNADTYMIVLRVCSEQKHKNDEVFDVAKDAFQKILTLYEKRKSKNLEENSSDGFDHTTMEKAFSWFCKCTILHLSDTEDVKKVLKSLFNRACKEGSVTPQILAQILNVNSRPPLIKEILEPHDVSLTGIKYQGNSYPNAKLIYERIPESWKKSMEH